MRGTDRGGRAWGAHWLIAPLLGEPIKAKLVAVALIASGLNSSITATLAGQIVMEGFLRLCLSPARRRLITRAIAIAPAIGVTLYAEVGATARRKVMDALRPTMLLAAVIAAAVIALNLKLLRDGADAGS